MCNFCCSTVNSELLRNSGSIYLLPGECDSLNQESPVEFSLRFRKFGWAKDFLLVSHEAEDISSDFIVAAHYDWNF